MYFVLDKKNKVEKKVADKSYKNCLFDQVKAMKEKHIRQ